MTESFLISSERIVMTPKKKTRNSTTLMMERKKICLTPAASSPLVGSNVHVAGGSNAGIIVNKQQIGDEGSLKKFLKVYSKFKFIMF